MLGHADSFWDWRGRSSTLCASCHFLFIWFDAITFLVWIILIMIVSDTTRCLRSWVRNHTVHFLQLSKSNERQCWVSHIMMSHNFFLQIIVLCIYLWPMIVISFFSLDYRECPWPWYHGTLHNKSLLMSHSWLMRHLRKKLWHDMTWYK